jgi:putative phosphoesterase
MKILVISDIHYENDIMKAVIAHVNEHVDKIFCLGDTSLKVDDERLKDIDLIVKGNHDFDDHFPITITYQNILLTHGNHQGVYASYDTLLKQAKDNNCTIVLHGHTHVPTHQIIDGVHFMNPGSLMINRGSYGYGTYALLETDPFSLHFYHHTTYRQVDDEVLEEGLETLAEFKAIARKYLRQHG